MEFGNNIYPLCIKCINCKIKKNSLSCKMGYFKNKTLNSVIILTALDFECDNYENFDIVQDINEI